MARIGVTCGVAVALGVATSSTVLPLSLPASIAVAASCVGFAARNVRAWPLVPWGLGVVRTAAVRHREERLRITAPTRVVGRVEVAGEEGSGVVVAVASRRFLVSEAGALPGPGHTFTGSMRVDPIRSRADPSAFRADVWAASRRLHGRARSTGAIDRVDDTPGPRGAVRRAVHSVRREVRRRVGFGEGAAGNLLTALLLGDRTGLVSPQKDAFRRAGLAHVLALSGMHVGILALGLASLLRATGWKRRAALLPTLAFLACFATLTGAHPPIVRACGTAALGLTAVLLGRRSHALHALGLVGAAMLLAHPPVWRDVGFRLSFLATTLLGIAATAARPAPKRSRGLGRVARGLGEAVLLSTAVTVGTLPVIAGSFGNVSLLSPVTNVLAGPPAAAALGWGGLAAAIPGPDWLHDAFARGARYAAQALLLLARGAEPLPGGEVGIRPLGPPALALVFLLAGHVAARRRPHGATRRAGAVLGGLVLLFAWPRDHLSVLDVGQGDAILVGHGGTSVLIDGGPPSSERGRSLVPRAVARRCRRLEAAIVTHGHADHLGGVGDLLGERRVGALAVPPRSGNAPKALTRLCRRAEALGVEIRQIGDRERPSRYLRGRLTVHSVWRGGVPPSLADENDHSPATVWRAGPVAARLLGDLGPAGEEELLAWGGDLRADILLAGHHGSRESSSPALLAACDPRLVLISCGAGNPHGHPHPELLERLRERGCGLLRTDRDGTLTITATRNGFRVRWQRGFPGAPTLFPRFPLSTRHPFS